MYKTVVARRNWICSICRSLIPKGAKVTHTRIGGPGEKDLCESCSKKFNPTTERMYWEDCHIKLNAAISASQGSFEAAVEEQWWDEYKCEDVLEGIETYNVEEFASRYNSHVSRFGRLFKTINNL